MHMDMRPLLLGFQGESICRGELTQATADKDLDALNLHLQKASELGLTGPEVEKAKALQKELLISHASLKALRCVGNPKVRFQAFCRRFRAVSFVNVGGERIGIAVRLAA